MTTVTIADALRVLSPNGVWNLLDSSDYASCVWLSPEVPQPTEEEVNAEIATLTAQQPFDACKAQATQLLYETDWTTIPDVANPAVSNPYLTNQAEFATYRSALRQLAVNPVENPTWPVKPNEQWSA